MVGKWAKGVLLCGLLAAGMPGLCASAPLNSTIPVLGQAAPQGTEDRGGPGVELFPVAPPQTTQSLPSLPSPAERVISSITRPGPTVRVALLLPMRSESLHEAADAVHDGFMAAYERDRSNAIISVISTGDSPQEILASYNDAAREHDIIIGPLARSAVAAVAQSGAVSVPTIALSQPETSGEAPASAPPKMLFIGLSTEDEARQAAQWAADDAASRALIVSTASPWQRRAARAFEQHWQRLGLPAQTLELSATSSGYLSPASLSQLKKKVQSEPPSLIFAALSSEQARQIRRSLGSEPMMYGTSQLNPLALPEWSSAEPMPEMNGVRLLDLPWQLQGDHPAVSLYPRVVASTDQKLDPDMERLYALGIDAYRVAMEIAMRHNRFEIEGVTGQLKVNFGNGNAHFERLEQPAVYRNGTVLPWNRRR